MANLIHWEQHLQKSMEAVLGLVSRLTRKTLLLRIAAAVAAFSLLLPMAAQADEPARMSLVYNESMFTLMAAVNACGYDQDVTDSLLVRSEIRTEVERATSSADAQQALLRLCKFYSDHTQGDDSRTLAQYVSLGLNLGDAPAFELKVKEADLAPDAAYVLGIVPLLQTFYVSTEMHKIYKKHRPQYEGALAKLHSPINNLLLSTDLYLRRPLSGYLGHSFTVMIEPLIAPSQSNSRNYGDDYYVVLSPDKNGEVKIDQVRHTYLHYLIEPMMLRRATAMQRLSPLLNAVATAPLDDSYKTDMALLTTESLIQAIEARQIGGRKGPEQPRLDYVNHAMREGFILTQYFYECLLQFEKTDTGFQQGFADWLHEADVSRELKRARDVQFLPSGEKEVVARNRRPVSLTELAERALASGNPEAASNFAKQALERQQDVGHANFILARVATMGGKPDDASHYFEQTLATSKDAREIAWSHIFLGRILDLKEEREQAVAQYKAALATPEVTADAKAAAEAGVEKPYEPKHKKTD